MPRHLKLQRHSEVLAELARLKRSDLEHEERKRLKVILLRYEEMLQWKEISNRTGLKIERIREWIKEAVYFGADFVVTGTSLRTGQRRGYSPGCFPFKTPRSEFEFWKLLRDREMKMSARQLVKWGAEAMGVELKPQFIYHYRRKHEGDEKPPSWCRSTERIEEASPEMKFLLTSTDLDIWNYVLRYYILNELYYKGLICNLIYDNDLSLKRWLSTSEKWKKQMSDNGIGYVSTILDLCSSSIGDDSCFKLLNRISGIMEFGEIGKSYIFPNCDPSKATFWKISSVYKDDDGHAMLLVPYRSAPDRSVYLIDRFMVKKGCRQPTTCRSIEKFRDYTYRSMRSFDNRCELSADRAFQNSAAPIILCDHMDLLEDIRKYIDVRYCFIHFVTSESDLPAVIDSALSL